MNASDSQRARPTDDSAAPGPRTSNISGPPPERSQDRIRKWSPGTIVGRTLLAILLILALVEGHARYFYGKTLQGLQDAVVEHRNQADMSDSAPLTLESVRPLIKGIPQQREMYRVDRPVQFVTYFSFFRTYCIRMELDGSGGIKDLDAGDWDRRLYSNEPRSIIEHLAKFDVNIPRRPGYSTNLGQIVQLDYAGYRKTRTYRYGYPQNLCRELFRQALLIAARDELSLPTRDVNFGESLLQIQKPEDSTAPLILTIQNRPAHDGYQLFLDRGPFDSPDELQKLDVEFAVDIPLHDVISRAEALSRTTFVEWLKQAGFSGRPNSLAESGSIPDEAARLSNRLIASAQLGVLRHLHRSIREDGESPEQLIALSGAYAVYGELTSPFLSPISDVARARALLYAERLILRAPNSAMPYFGRARVRTLIGLHALAIEDIEHARHLLADGSTSSDDPKSALPDWVGTIEAACHGDIEQLRSLSSAGVETSSLAALLWLQQVDAARDDMAIATAAKRLEELEPGQSLALDQLMTNVPPGPEYERLQDALVRSTQSLADNARNLSGLSDSLQELIANVPDSVPECATWRLSFRDSLLAQNDQIADGTVADLEEPALTALVGLSQESALIQAVRTMELATHPHGITPDELFTQLKPLVDRQSYREWYLFYSPKRREIWSEITADFSSSTRGKKYWTRNGKELLQFLSIWNPPATGANGRNDWREAVESSTSKLLGDLAWQFENATGPERKRNASRAMMKVAPYSEAAVVATIRNDWQDSVPHVAEWEQKFARSPRIQAELGTALLYSRQFDDAERCLERSLRLRMDRDVLVTLAKCSLERGDETKWLERMERAARLPAGSLESHYVSYQIAAELLARGRLQDAFPYAERAAETYSAWGLLTLAACHEAASDYAKAEKLVRASAENYERHHEWYFWCRRTGRGDEAAARAAIPTEWMKEVQTEDSDNYCSMHMLFAMLDDDLQTAIIRMRIGLDNGDAEGPWSFVHLEFLKQEYGKPVPDPRWPVEYQKVEDPNSEEFRNARFGKALECYGRYTERGLPTEPVRFLSELRRHFSSPDPKPLNLHRLDWIVQAWGSSGSRTNMLYFIGKALMLDGRTEEAIPYFELAATSRYSQKYNAMLAGHELQKLGRLPGPLRPSELEFDEAQNIRLYDEACGWGNVGDIDRALQRCDLLIEQAPDWSPAWFARGRFRTMKADFAAAISDFDQLIRLEPDLPEAYLNRGYALQAAGRFADAATDYEKALELEPREDGAHWLIGMIRAAAPDSALRDGQAALLHVEALDDFFQNRQYNRNELLAAAHAELGDFDKAAEFARQWLTGAPETRMERIAQYENRQPYRLKPYEATTDAKAADDTK
ncbi:tetratricopeptide repeat protein [bacterium]|nr:tetratricopeptide repeat protein [bacterium]